MLSEIKHCIAGDRRILWVLIAGLAVQLITSITQIGVSSADQHFQIIEFSLYQLGKPNGAVTVWEIENFVRPTLQVYLFSGYHLLCNAIQITDPYTQLAILRVLLGTSMWFVFNLMAFHYFRSKGGNTLLYVLLLVNLSWALPYTRTLFSSEMMSSLFFFGTLALYDYYKDRSPRLLLLAAVGFLFCMAFYFRFQAAFGMLGVAAWLLFFERKYRHILPIAIGFLAGLAVNVYLDYRFYNELVITPYTYFYANIIDGRADYFGRSSFLRYIGLLILVAPAPLFSFIIFIYLLKTSMRQFANPVVLSVLIFVICHSLVGHKEERFMFPVFNAIPFMIGWSLPDLQRLLLSGRKWIAILCSILIGTTIFLNFVLLTTLTVLPYSQTILFSKKLHERFPTQRIELFCIGQAPFETPAGNQMEFYKIASRNITVSKVKKFDLKALEDTRPKYITAAYNEVKENFSDLERLGYRRVMVSSGLLWGLNETLHASGANTINEIWALYER